MNSIIDLTWFF